MHKYVFQKAKPGCNVGIVSTDPAKDNEID